MVVLSKRIEPSMDQLFISLDCVRTMPFSQLFTSQNTAQASISSSPQY